ncbi:hypothetical protein [Kozakia baliensis]|nr:hypothetical protein [Kozakia baliensis]GBR28281.1 hypothetical protein AA0488_1368 [Kozakia baliensis NRIC 0488]GEL63731.1 hypothetical protein KBA01_10170 [Kozakia baliensis]
MLKTMFPPQSNVTRLPTRLQNKPAMTPEIDTLVLCPACHHKMRRTEEICPGCGAERLFGPTRAETFLSTGTGLIAAPALSTLLIAPSIWTAGFAAVGALLGFFVAHSRHSGDRWLKHR